jgi:hypothetical protein
MARPRGGPTLAVGRTRQFGPATSSATLGSGSTFVGTIMALTSITVTIGVAIHGRALARNGQATLIHDTITSSTCFKGGGGSTPPATDTLAPTNGSASGPNAALLFTAALFVAFVLVVSRRKLTTARDR